MNSTVNISFNKNLLKQIDKIARDESRSRSELIREAARLYIERKNRWHDLFSHGKKLAGEKQLTEKDVLTEIGKYRKDNL